ncbi:heavy metal translocating P-type ATPase [Candidatus Mycoplasma mahonii]|uniref:heavy metal translocating P-type ATPase n=1 Tax=Candidatus Mycoplasma mahonii TaxID=3004105 RepID=UPI0026EA4A25|nr:cation-translocating P-type ATPase [Candidatus Mycoplasma mahonii]WKX02165.1 cation-translocating P-type ATPase [Candidatus Mycoplasma mahonii]
MKQENHNRDKTKGHQYHYEDKSKSRWFWIRSILLLIPFLYFIILNLVQPSGPISWTWHYGIWFPLTSYLIFWEGRRYLKIYQKAFKGIYDMDTLIGLASHILFIFSIGMSFFHYDSPMFSYTTMWEGPAVLIVVTNIGHKVESSVKQSSLKAYEELENMKNPSVTIFRNNQEYQDKAENLKIGDLIIVRKGEIVGLDGLVQSNASFDYSNITGESKNIRLSKNQFVISGSYNLGDDVLVKVTKNYNESTISTIIESIENVSMAKPKLQKIADKILKWFVPVVLLISLTTLIVWLATSYTVGINLPWVKNDSNFILSISAAVTVIAIACPCALGIATPLVYAVSSTLAAKNGILINNPIALEELARVKIYAFDKTGTITSEKFNIKKMTGNKKYIGLAKTLEQNVKHPIAATILELEGKMEKVTKITSTNIDGVKGMWNGHKVAIKRYLKGNKETTNIALYIDNKPELIFELENVIKPGVKDVIKQLKSKGIWTIMITGDQKEVALTIGHKIGINEIHYEIKPDQKATIIRTLQEKEKVAFIGDGFNDSIAIKQADISIAFSSGSDITNSLSDISIINNNFTMINKVRALSSMNNRWVIMALTYAFMFNVITIPVAFLLLVQPWVGASLMATSDVLVATNAFAYKVLGNRWLNKN